MLTVFDGMIDNTEANQKLSVKLNYSQLFFHEFQKTKHFTYYFEVSKDIRIKSTHCFIIKIPNKRELQQISSSHSSDIRLKIS